MKLAKLVIEAWARGQTRAKLRAYAKTPEPELKGFRIPFAGTWDIHVIFAPSLGGKRPTGAKKICEVNFADGENFEVCATKR